MPTDSAELTSKPSPADPGEIVPRFRVIAPSLGKRDAKLSVSPDDKWILSIEAAVHHAPGSLLPLTLVHVPTSKEIPLMCSVAGDVAGPDGNQVGLELVVTNLNPERKRLLSTWIEPAAPAADGPDLSDLVVDAVVPVGQKSAAVSAANAAARERYEDFIARAATAERDRKIPEAMALYEEALAAYPVEAVRLHLRLGKLALEALGDIPRALNHAKEATCLAPESQDAKLLLQRVTEGRASRQLVKAAPAPAPRGIQLNRRGVVAIALVVAFLLTASWMVWRHLLPHGPRPEPVDLALVTKLIPARAARLYDNTLFVTITDGWSQLNMQQKEERLRQLAQLASDRFHASRVVVSDPQPMLVGTVEGGRISVLR